MAILPVGFRFSPTDEELISFYLSKKLRGEEIFPQNLVKDCDLYSSEPCKLFDTSSIQNFYVFVKLDKNGKMTRRRAGSGTWAGQNHFEVKDQDGRVIGAKKLFNFKDNTSGTIWLMHELYSLECDDLVVCRIRIKDAEKSVDKYVHPKKRTRNSMVTNANPVNRPKKMTHNSMGINANPVFVQPQGDNVNNVHDQPELDYHHYHINGNSSSMNGIDMIQFNAIQNANLPFKETDPLMVEPGGEPLAIEGNQEDGQIIHAVQENQNYYTNDMNCSSEDSVIFGWLNLSGDSL